jgi:hypothetical protein
MIPYIGGFEQWMEVYTLAFVEMLLLAGAILRRYFAP